MASKHVKNALALILGITAPAPVAWGQVFPWDIFDDSESSSRCDVINAANAELVLLTDTDQLVIVTGTDVTLEDTFVDEEGSVFFEGEFVGLIGFEDDGDDLRTLWWTGLTGHVVEVDPFTGEPSATTLFPSDFDAVPCDACDFWDDQDLCEQTFECIADEECTDGNVCTIDACVSGQCIQIDNDGAECNDGRFCTLLDTCVEGECVGVGTPCLGRRCNESANECESLNPQVTISLCGTNMALTSGLIAAGLMFMPRNRRRGSIGNARSNFA